MAQQSGVIKVSDDPTVLLLRPLAGLGAAVPGVSSSRYDSGAVSVLLAASMAAVLVLLGCQCRQYTVLNCCSVAHVNASSAAILRINSPCQYDQLSVYQCSTSGHEIWQAEPKYRSLAQETQMNMLYIQVGYCCSSADLESSPYTPYILHIQTMIIKVKVTKAHLEFKETCCPWWQCC